MSKLEALVTKVRKHRDESLAKVSPPLPKLPEELPLNVTKLPQELLTPREVELTGYDAPELIELMSSKKVSCEEVTRAFLRRAALAQELTNCVTELLWDHAIERAKQLDALPQPAGPLHGLPVSVKEQCGLHIPAGLKTNGGYAAWIDRPQQGKCDAAHALYDAGAVFYVRTTEPQSVMHLETSTPMFGVTVNPYNRNLTSGGSTGGEGALLGLRGSVLGIGSDIGGSIRNPAGNNGVYGLKPTPVRVSGAGAAAWVFGQEGIASARGPMSTSREGIELFMKTYLDSEPWKEDDTVPPMPWVKQELPKRLKIAVLWDDGIVKPHPPVMRALKEVVEKCKAAGMEIVDWKPVDHDKAWEITSSLYFTDGGKKLLGILEEAEEPMMPLTKFILQDNPHCKYRTTEELWELRYKRDGYCNMYSKLWHDTGAEDGHIVDAILCPYLPGAAPPFNNSKYWSYTSQWNILQYPAVVFPVTQVDPAIDVKEDYTPRNAQDEFNYKLYEPEVYRDAPVSLQLVTRKYQDEKVMQVLEKIEHAMGRK